MAQHQQDQFKHIRIVSADEARKEFGFTWGHSPGDTGNIIEGTKEQHGVVLASTKHAHEGALSKNVQFRSLRDVLQQISRQHLVRQGGNVAQVSTTLENGNSQMAELRAGIQNIQDKLSELYTAKGDTKITENHKDIHALETELASLRAKLTFLEKFDDSHISLSTSRRSSTKSAPELESDQGSDDEIDFVDLSELDMVQEDLKVSYATNSLTSIKPAYSSTLFVPDPCQEQAMQQLRTAIVELSEQLAHTRSALGMIKIELSNIGFSDGNMSSKDILLKIRQVFQQARIDFREMFPEHDLGKIQNSAMLDLVLSHSRGILTRMEEQVLRIQRQEEAIALYRAEYIGILNKLSEKDGQCIHLQESEQHVKQLLEEKSQQIQSIETTMQMLTQRIGDQQLDITFQLPEQAHFRELFIGLSRKLVANAQEERRATDQTIATLKANLETERSAKEEATREVSQKHKLLLDLRTKSHESKKSLLSSEAALTHERQSHQSTERKLQQKIREVTELETKLNAESKHGAENQRKLAIAKEALIIQKKQNKNEMHALREQRHALEAQLSEMGGELNKIRTSYKRKEERIMSLEGQIHGTQEHTKTLITRLDVLNSSLTQKATLVKNLESKISLNEQANSRRDDEIRELKEQVKSISNAKSSLEKLTSQHSSEQVELQASSSAKIQALELRRQSMQTTIEEQSSQLIQIEQEYEEERKTSAKLRTQIEQIQANARSMARSLEDATGFIQKVQGEVVKRVVEEMALEQKNLKDEFSKVKTEYEGVMTGIESIRFDVQSEHVKKGRKKEVRVEKKSSKQTTSSEQVTAITGNGISTTSLSQGK